MAWAWRAATATELKKQKPQAASGSAWWPGGRTTATPFKTWGRGRKQRLDHPPSPLSLPFCLFFPVSSPPTTPPAAKASSPSPCRPHPPGCTSLCVRPLATWGCSPLPLRTAPPVPFPQAWPNSQSRLFPAPPCPQDVLAKSPRSPPQSAGTSPASTASTRRQAAPAASCAQAKVLEQM